MKCAGVGVAKLSKNSHVWCGSVRSEKLLCAECAGVPKLAALKYLASSINARDIKIETLTPLSLMIFHKNTKR